jgi:hypothetical protein
MSRPMTGRMFDGEAEFGFRALSGKPLPVSAQLSC